MQTDSEIKRLLSSIDRRLALLSAPQDRALRLALETEVLRTPARIAMFGGIDGVRGSGEIATLARVSDRAAQLFVKELLTMGLVRPVTDSAGRTVIVERDEEAIIEWYLARPT